MFEHVTLHDAQELVGLTRIMIQRRVTLRSMQSFEALTHRHGRNETPRLIAAVTILYGAIAALCYIAN